MFRKQQGLIWKTRKLNQRNATFTIEGFVFRDLHVSMCALNKSVRHWSMEEFVRIESAIKDIVQLQTFQFKAGCTRGDTCAFSLRRVKDDLDRYVIALDEDENRLVDEEIIVDGSEKETDEF